MEERIITFTANEQGLVKTGGISHYASDTISYIKAVFTLGENWQGFDEVRAVFKSPYECRPAVLDSNGECYVPVEVLFYKGKVKVNLVGSIVTETEVTDRLTTYSVEALDVDEDVPICGEESQPISPSEYEQFVAKVANDANRAEQSATDAKTYADEAEASAQNASESASASAVSASDSARSATASAESAQNASEIAVEVEVMKNEVELAKDKVLGMRATAETLEAGSDATASYSDGLLTLGIPRGDQGIQGIQGETGATPNLTIGTVETLAPTEDATATITGTAENPVLNLGIPKGDTGEVSLEDLEALLPTDTASGDIVSIPDGQSVIPAESLKVELEPIQDLHGYDKPWAGGAGKQLIPIIESASYTRSGITADVGTDGVISVSGTSTNAFSLTFADFKLPAGSYAFSGYGSTATNSGDAYTTVYIRDVDASQTLASINVGNTDRRETFTISEEANVRFYIVVGEANITLSGTLKCLLCLSSNTDTTYEPYSNICPISGRTEVETIVSPTTEVEDGETYTTDLGQTVYGGVLDVVSGELVVDRAMVTFDGSESGWYEAANGRALYIRLNNVLPHNPNYSWNLIGNYAEATGYATSMPPLWKMCVNPAGNLLVGIPTTITSVADWKTYLASNPLQVVYELAEPQTYQLTPQEIRLLLGTNNIWSDGKVTLTYSADVTKWLEKKLNGNSTTLTMSRPMTEETE